MKKLDQLILRSFVGPLVLTFVIAVFVLLMQFVWKYIDDLVGKGLDFAVIAELLLYASATFVPMALPISVLFASIMTMGNFGEKYELIAMKASGVSVRRIMVPMAVVALLLTGVAFYFANNVMPTAMLKYKMTLYDITRKKPAVNIRPSQYYTEIDGYVIRANQKDDDDRTLRDVIIYDHSQGLDNTNIVVADRGVMQSTPDDRYLVFTLYEGYTYSEPMGGADYESRPLTRIGFEKQELSFDISSFAFAKSDDDVYQGNYQMMNVYQLDTTVKRLNENYDSRCVEYIANLSYKLRTYRLYRSKCDSVRPSKVRPIAERLQAKDATRQQQVLSTALATAKMAASDAELYAETLVGDQTYINRFHVEWQRKYTLSLACLLLFLIGAPFGSIVRKGGLGLPLVASVIFFVIYYVIGMISEKMVREGAVGPVGMWYSSIAFLPIGIFLTLKATTDSSLFDGSVWQRKVGSVLSKWRAFRQR
ncbi:MAG: LptF/LptG family permease [Bacteroidales bacterium]|nr:LptF/LptG family permease [Candidatus Colimorpha onthohippi]